MRQKYFFTIIYTLLSFCIFSQTTPPIDPIGPIEPADPPTGPPILFERPPVGKTEGNLEVSLTGAAVYTVPIKVPQGVNGVEPKISLQYNSQSGNGIAGLGWGVSGGSSITRIPSTLYHDGKVSAVNFSKDDRFALDGQRLILKSGTYGGDGAEYQTENYSNLKITSHGVSPYGTTYGPKYFSVTYPDGSIATYGNTNDSRSRTEFAINGWKNTSGINMVYSYEEKGGILFLSSIKYVSKIVDYYTPSNDSLVITPMIDIPQFRLYDNEVKFYYTTRNDVNEEFYIGGQQFNFNQNLYKIETKSGSNVLRTYELEYDRPQLGYLQLKKIKELNGINEAPLAPLEFVYNRTEGKVKSTTQLYTRVTNSNLEKDITTATHNIVTGDFDGDGDLDYILYDQKKAEYWVFNTSINHQKTGTYKLVNNAAKFKNIFPFTNVNQNNELQTKDSWLTIIDNKITVNKFENNSILEDYSKTFNFPPVSSDFESPFVYGGDYEFVPDRNYYIGDFKGNGQRDILAIQKVEQRYIETCDYYGERNGTHFYSSYQDVFLLNMDRNEGNSMTYIGFIPHYNMIRVMTQDFTGDGKTDILAINKGAIVLYTINSITNKLELAYQYTDDSITQDSQINLGDFNGDAKLDLLIANPNSSNFYYSTGTSFERKNANRSFYYDPKGYGYDHNRIFENTGLKGLRNYKSIICDDIDNDGKTDIIQISTNVQTAKNTPFSSYVGSIVGVYVMKNMGGELFESSYINEDNYWTESLGIIMPMYGDEMYFPIPFNLTPNRNFAFTKNNYRLGFFASGAIIEFELSYNTNRDKLLKDIKSDGIVTQIQYGQYGINQQSLDFPHFQKFDTKKVQYPLAEFNFLPNTSVVSKIKVNDGSRNLFKSFSYASPIANLHGLGFLGFKGIVSTNWYDKTENMYKNIKEFDITKRGALKKESVISANQWDSFIPSVSGGGGFPISKSYESITNYEYNSQLLTNKVFKLQNTKITHTDYNGQLIGGSFVKEVVNVFNTYNDITKQTAAYKYISPFVGSTARIDKTEITENTYAYAPSGTNYYMSRLTKTKKTQTALNEVGYVTEDTFVYDAKGRVTEIKKKGNSAAVITEKNTYDTYGNITEKKVLAGSLVPRVMNYKYGYHGRFMTEKTDLDGLKTTYKYNSAKGLLTEETNPYGQTTKYGYNNWGQQTSVTDYLGKITKTTYVKNGKNVEITTTNDEGSWGKEYFDVSGNKTKASVKNIAGDLVQKSFEYDNYNRVIKESENYFGSTPLLWTTTEYDKKGRVKKVIDSKGKEIATTYSLTKTTVNDGTTTKEVTINAAGDIVSRKDAGGTINYKYFSNGNMKSSDYGGVVITVEQDGWGRKTKLTDPSAGVYTYEYNALGELVKETTPKGSTQFTLDNSGKITKKKITGDQTNSEINYTYDGTTKLLTQSQAAIGGQNHTYNYSYDSNKRLNKTVETTPLATFTKEVTYDEYGRTAQETFRATAYGKTSEKKIKNSYKNGHHWQITDAVSNVVLTSNENTNEYGLLTKVKLGNQLEINNVYDGYGYLKTNSVKKNTTELFKLTNTFDVKRGNLMNRTNGLFNRHETFSYDELDRLTSFTNKAGIQETQVYDNRGRIESNNVGDYDYTGGTSYQLASIDLNAEAQAYYILRPEQQVLYNAFKSPVWIKEQGKENIYFQYNANNQRSTMYYGNEATDKAQSSFRRHYSADGAMEITYDTATGKADFVTYIGGDAYSAIVIAKGETTQHYFYLHRDYLGSILAITNASGSIVEKRHFDAWGNLVFVKDGQNNDLAKLTFLDRGYTGHEHLQGVALIHMNGRLYDPVVKRFLAPDNFVQDPTNTQNFNRYGYVLNNPLKYTDESGEILGTIVTGFFDLVGNVLKHGVNFDHYNWNKTERAWQIDRGLFTGNLGQILIKWTWGFRNTLAGNITGHALNIIGLVDEVTHSNGAVALGGITSGNKAFTLGNYIFGPDDFKADWRDHLFVHEYGHYIQSQIFGPLFLPVVASTSLLSALGLGGDEHKTRWFEVQASRLGGKYFDKKEGSGRSDYFEGSPNHFDYNSFKNGGDSPYINVRREGNYQGTGNPTSGARFNFWDIGVPILTFSLVTGVEILIL